MMKEALLVSCIRTPTGKFNGGLSHLTSYELGAVVLQEALTRAGLLNEMVDEVIMGNIMSTESRGNPAREAALKAGFPYQVKSYTVNKNCGSGLKALNLAATMIRSGESEIIAAGGMENMSRIPYIMRGVRTGLRMGHGKMRDLLIDLLEGMGITAENVARRYGISREEQDRFALESQMLAAGARKKGLFKEQIVPVWTEDSRGKHVVCDDEGIKPETTLEGLSGLKPVFMPDGSVTAGNSSTINDGAAAVMLLSEDKVRELGVKPLARIVSWGEAGVEPSVMGIGPVPATRLALRKAGLSISDLDLIELNEAFAAQALAVIKELDMDREKVNVNGGAIALGHPVGATGSILVVKLVNELLRVGGKRGLVTLCIGGGQGIATVIELV